MIHSVTLQEASTDLPRLIREAAEGEVVILEGGKPVAKLVALPGGHGAPQFGSARGLVEVGPDFDDPVPGFEEYSQ